MLLADRLYNDTERDLCIFAESMRSERRRKRRKRGLAACSAISAISLQLGLWVKPLVKQ